VNTIGRFALSAIIAASCHWLPALADEAGQVAPIPSFAELEAAGAVIGEVRINPQNIFDMDDPKENYGFYPLVNKLHIQTRPSVIRRGLLFRSGERVSVRVIEESERLLRSNHFLYDVSIQPIAYRDGVVDVEVRTRDTWSLEPGGSFSGARQQQHAFPRSRTC
jgi:hypothetical protein